jgi:hypothetical protein
MAFLYCFLGSGRLGFVDDDDDDDGGNGLVDMKRVWWSLDDRDGEDGG